MYLKNIFVLTLLTCIGITLCSTQDIYKNELKAFEKMEEYKTIFDKDADDNLRCIQRDVALYKELTLLQRLIRFMFLSCDAVVITPTTMPKLYEYVATICTKNNMPMPTIFITRKKGFFNAFASKLLMSSGGILLGKKMIRECTDNEIEAMVAHELGHIKYNHVNKTLALLICTYVVMAQVTKKMSSTLSNNVYLKMYLSSILTAFIINKQFEKQADEFAYREMDKGTGVIELFEHLKQKEAKYDADFPATYELLQKNKDDLSMYSYITLICRYYLTSGGNYVRKAFQWVYYNTPYGAHPSHDERIKAVQEYFAEQKVA